MVAWALGRMLKGILIRELDGLTTWTSSPHDFHAESMTKSDWIQVEKDLLILLAGEFSEKAYRELGGSYDDVYLSDDDRKKVAELLERVGEHESPAIDLSMGTLERKIVVLVEDECWDQIEALAQELIVKGEMSGDDATRLIESI
ncbi:MAG: hypothetical protein ACREXQ_01680 [Polaromonas sp.]